MCFTRNENVLEILLEFGLDALYSRIFISNKDIQFFTLVNIGVSDYFLKSFLVRNII